jgi:hypothetical protein
MTTSVNYGPLACHLSQTLPLVSVVVQLCQKQRHSVPLQLTTRACSSSSAVLTQLLTSAIRGVKWLSPRRQLWKQKWQRNLRIRSI